MPTQNERKFPVFRRGEIRDTVLLAQFRNALRGLTNPDTGQAFTEDEIAVATRPDSRFYIEADAIDLMTQLEQARGLFLVAQARPKWANSAFLDEVYIPLWLGASGRLAATGGSGAVNAPATPGSIFPGSTTLGDPSAAVATDPNGLRFQVLSTVTTPAGGVAALTMRGIDTGLTTNLVLGTVLTWSANQPLGAEPQAAVAEDPAFTGGFNVETDWEAADRVESRMRHRPAVGNSAHFEAWARQISNAVESAFVYPVALHAGSTLVAILQKRNTTALEGPTIRCNPAPGTMHDVTNYLVPPNSPVVPERVFVLVTSANSQPSSMSLRVAMPYAIAGGWFQSIPWPNPPTNTVYPQVLVTAVTSQTEFEVETDGDLPGGVASLVGEDAPQLMLWNVAVSRWERLDVAQVDKAGVTATVTLNNPPSFTIATGAALSPYTDRLEIIAQAAEVYFDGLGPGEVVDLATDPRGGRAWRYPPPSEGYPARAGQAILNDLLDALGGAAADAELIYASRNAPDLPTYISDGPNIVTLGQLSVFPL